MATAAEMIGTALPRRRLQRAAARSSSICGPHDLLVDPAATSCSTTCRSGRSPRRACARAGQGGARRPTAACARWPSPGSPGKILGGFDMHGPARRRSERPHPARAPPVAARQLGAVRLAVGAAIRARINTLDSYVEESGRRFVRHYFFDFGCAFGSATTTRRGRTQDGEHLVEVGRTLGALLFAGLLPAAVPGPARRVAASWSPQHPAIGYFPAEELRPRRLPDRTARCRRTCA